MTGDDPPLHFARSFIDRRDTNIPIEPGDLIFFTESIATMNLQAIPAGSIGGFRGEEFGLRGEPAGVVTLLRGRGSSSQTPGGFETRCHLGDGETNGLELGNWAAKLHPLPGVVDGQIEGTLMDADSLCRDAET